MNKNKISKVIISFFLAGSVIFGVSGCGSNDNNVENQAVNTVENADTNDSAEASKDGNSTTKGQEDNTEAQNKQQAKGQNQDRQMQEVEADPVLQAAAEAILADTELFGELDDESKMSMITSMQPMIFNMLNENLGFSLQDGIIIKDEELGIDISIFQSDDVAVDADLFANSGDLENTLAGDKVANREVPNGETANGQAPNTQEPNGEVSNEEASNGAANSQAPNGGQRTQGQRMTTMPDIENSESKIIGNYIIFANTDNNEAVFSICEESL